MVQGPGLDYQPDKMGYVGNSPWATELKGPRKKQKNPRMTVYFCILGQVQMAIRLKPSDLPLLFNTVLPNLCFVHMKVPKLTTVYKTRKTSQSEIKPGLLVSSWWSSLTRTRVQSTALHLLFPHNLWNASLRNVYFVWDGLLPFLELHVSLCVLVTTLLPSQMCLRDAPTTSAWN